MLNTDLHSRNIKPEKKMRLEQFIKNLRGMFDQFTIIISTKLDRIFLSFVLTAYIYSNVDFFQCKYREYDA
jgi:Sec7-like guanine-nucleotide exchange factor